MIRRVTDFVLVLLFVWACMLLGLWVIGSVIVPFELPEAANGIATGVGKVSFSALLVLIWLWAWREIVRRIFWHEIRAQRPLGGSTKNSGGDEPDLPRNTS